MPTWKELGFPNSKTTQCLVCRRNKLCSATKVVRKGRNPGGGIVMGSVWWVCSDCWKDYGLVVYCP